MIYNHKVLGIIGGMGPLATANIFEKIIYKTDANRDSEHIHILIDNFVQIPDRTNAILNGSNEPLKYLIDSANRLEKDGADLLIMTCCTAHYYLEDIRKITKINIIDMIEETAKKIDALGIKKVGLLATTGTIKTGIFHKQLNKYNIDVHTLNENGQQELMNIIYNQVKKGEKINLDAIYEYLNIMRNNGVELFILGCTELPIAFKNVHNYVFIDPTEILLEVAISKLGYNIRDKKIEEK